MSRNLKLAVVQLRTEFDLDETIEKAGVLVAEAAKGGAEFVCLPEMWSCPYSKEYFRKTAVLGHAKPFAAMARWAKENNICLVGGSVPELEDGVLYNTAFVFDKSGNLIAKHRKMHLFDVDIPGMRFMESHTFAPGNEITTFDTEYGKMGVGICFDVRFPELFRAMAVRGAEIVFLPAQFGITTGSLHWELTLRARAMDNEFFMVGAAAARYEGFSYECWGHSIVTGPYGDIIATCDEKEQILYADIDLDRVNEVRAQLPTFTRLRREIYSVAE